MSEIGGRLLALLALVALLCWYLLLAAVAILATAALFRIGWELIP